MKVLKWLDKNAELFFISFALVVISGIMFFQVIMRYVFKSALPWPEEACRYTFVWLSYIGISYAVKDDSHMKVDIIHTMFPKTAPYLNVLGDAALLGMMILMIKPSLNTALKIRKLNTVSAAMGFPMWIVYFSLTVGVTLGVVRMIQKYYFKIKNSKSSLVNSEKTIEQ